MLRAVRTTAIAIIPLVLGACAGGDAPTGSGSPAARTATLTVNAVGLPPGTSGSITVSGPDGFSRTLAGTTTITSLKPGAYVVAAAAVESENAILAPLPDTQHVDLQGGASRGIEVAYNVATATLDVDVRGLPAGAQAAVNVAGPNGFFRQLHVDAQLAKLAPGAYVITAANVLADGDGYSATPSSATITLAAGTSPYLATVDYALYTGRLTVLANGLPQGANVAFQITTPTGQSQSATPSQVLMALTPGAYTVTAPNVSFGNTTYVPSPASASVTVSASTLPAQATVNYAVQGGASGAPINLTIENLYITQAVQNWAGDVPLVAGRDGLVRVFVKANGPNALQPQVRVRFYHGPNLVSTLTLNAPAAAVPTSVHDSTLTAAWYAQVPGALIQQGLRVLADVDPANAIAEGSEADNGWPLSGTPATMFVKTVAPLSIRFVPIRQSNDLTGNVSAANTAAFLNDIRRMFPVGTIDADVRATYTSNSGIVQANDNNSAWGAVLNEINTLRALDGSARYYYGVVRTTYSSGVAGMGYLGRPVSIGWDHLPSGADVMAHELGHNWGRYHAPCGGAGMADPSYPYAGGKIGVSGYDITTGIFKLPILADLMGYCVPNWVSDFTYKGIMTFRETQPLVAAARARAPEPGLLVWGRIAGDAVVLEPAFEVVAAPVLPAADGPHLLEGRAPDGTLAFALRFDGDALDHGRPGERHFAYVIPFSAMRGVPLGSLRLVAGGRSAELRSSAASARAVADSAPLRVRRSPSGMASVNWSGSGVRGLLVRDAGSGDVLAIARGGAAQLVRPRGDVDVIVSDGVRSSTRRMRMAPM